MRTTCPECRADVARQGHVDGCPFGPLTESECEWCGDEPKAEGDRLCAACRQLLSAAEVDER